jgi:predicted DNA-binding protein (UPF0251 family)
MTSAANDLPSLEEMEARRLKVAEEQLHWMRAAAIPQVRHTVDAALTSSKERKAFELCDGNRTSTEVGRAVGVPKTTLSGWTRKWRNLGIAYEVDERKIRHLTSLAALELALEVKEGA